MWLYVDKGYTKARIVIEQKSWDALGEVMIDTELPEDQFDGITSVSCETHARVSPSETKCETGRNPGEIANLHHFFRSRFEMQRNCSFSRLDIHKDKVIVTKIPV